MKETKYLKKTNALLTFAIILGVLALGASVFKNIITENWAKSRNTVACIPAESEYAFPIVYHQTSAHPIPNDALVKSFVEEYIHLTLDEQIVDYHKVTNNQRYNDARLSQSRWQAIEMSCCAEKALNLQRYTESNEVFYTLKQGNMGWVFLIDDILIMPGQKNGATLAVVRGEFQVTFDKVKVDLPPRLWGYREITLLINEGVPVEDTKGNFVNKYGMFVAWSSMQTLSPEQKESRANRNHEYYLKEENL